LSSSRCRSWAQTPVLQKQKQNKQTKKTSLPSLSTTYSEHYFLLFLLSRDQLHNSSFPYFFFWIRQENKSGLM
jgi:hypothetical protein